MIALTKTELAECFKTLKAAEARFIQIINADVGAYPNVPADGAYDLCGQIGSPTEIGRVIEDCLRDVDLFGGRDCESTLQQGAPVYVNIKLRIVLPSCGGKPQLYGKEDK